MGFVTAGTGDVIAQAVERSPEESLFPLDRRRMAVFSIFGATWTGLVNSAWLPLLNRVVPGTRLRDIGSRVAIQQLWWNPVFFMPCFYCAYGLGYNLGWHGTLDKARREYWSSLVACWQIWFPSSFVAFCFPPQHQSIIMAVMNLVWNARLSMESSAKRWKGNNET